MDLTVDDINLLLDAVDAWTTASQTSSMLGGLLFGAMMSSKDDTSAGKDIVTRMMEGEEEKTANRKEQAALIKAKLIKMRDAIEAKDFAESK